MADPLRLTEVRPGRDLVQSLLAVSHASTQDELLSTNIAGFLYVTAVDLTHGTVTYLAPLPWQPAGQIPSDWHTESVLRVSYIAVTAVPKYAFPLMLVHLLIHRLSRLDPCKH